MHSFIPALVRTFALLSIVCASAAAAQDNSWTLQPDARIEVQTISAQTTTRDDDLVVDGEAISVGGQVGVALEKDGVRVFSGLTDDPFFFDSQGLTETRQTGNLSFRNTRDFFGAQNITAVAIEIPRERLENGTNELDFWVLADRR